MKVARAIPVLSPDVTVALEHLRDQAGTHRVYHSRLQARPSFYAKHLSLVHAQAIRPSTSTKNGLTLGNLTMPKMQDWSGFR
ncbi:hypothetical protein HPB48_026006 [Haemaphysalis longicornis]|uniref:Uncharacterized protein n=1 Tax=Haemaphysalis longicornis TaxID=44386 RepID=A0A9J6H007_HAELO|nr:hypothetical protein HPB48_026006 [Haemaphysalis longicornis]